LRLGAVLLAALLASCTDEPSSPSSPQDSAAAAARAQGVGRSSLDLVEADYAGGLLDRENANKYRQYAVFPSR
jgi:hypothetical protein